MKKLIIAAFLTFLLINGCEKDYDEIINPSIQEIRVTMVGEQDSLDYGLGDSTSYFRIKIVPPFLVNSINAVVKDPFGRDIASVELFDNGNTQNSDSTAGDSVYSNKFIFSDTHPSGQYSISYYVNQSQAAVQFFYFDDGKEKFPPVISELNIRDSVTFNEEFTFTIRAVDANGYEDIVLVYFEFFRPDGSQVVNSQGISKFYMNDTANPDFGDETAGDSIYTFKLTFPSGMPTVPPGTWRLEFEAVDRSNRLSNKIIHYLEVH